MNNRRMTYQEKEARKTARDRARLIFNEVADLIKKLPVQDPNNWKYANSMTIRDLARLLAPRFLVSESQARGIVSFYVSTRPDLYVTKGRKGGIQRVQ
jgi:hypothetical protein